MGQKIGLSCSPNGKETACSTGDPSSIPGLGRSPKEGNHNPLQCSCLGNHLDRGAWQAIVHGCKESGITKRLTLHHSGNIKVSDDVLLMNFFQKTP